MEGSSYSIWIPRVPELTQRAWGLSLWATAVNPKNLQFLPLYPIQWFPQLHKDQTYSKIANTVSSTGECHSHSDNILIPFCPEEIYVPLKLRSLVPISPWKDKEQQNLCEVSHSYTSTYMQANRYIRGQWFKEWQRSPLHLWEGWSTSTLYFCIFFMICCNYSKTILYLETLTP